MLGVSGLIVRGLPPIGMALTGVFIQNLGVVWTVLIVFGCRVVIAVVTMLNADVRNAVPVSELQAGER